MSLEVREGESLGLLGPNGAGKSTTISMIAGLIASDSGSVALAGGAPTDAAVRRQLGIVPQSIALYEELTAEENLRFFGGLYGLSGRGLAERVAWALDFVGLTDRRRGRVRTFSGGMKRRINIAAALLHEPAFVIFDEPTAGVDPHSRNLIFDNIEALKAEGLTIIYTTHYMEEAARLCDRVAIVDHGRLLAIGTVAELVDAHGGISTIEVEFSELPADAASLGGRLDGCVLHLESEAPFEEMARLSSLGVAFTRLEVRRATLESVFLNLTGRSLRD